MVRYASCRTPQGVGVGRRREQREMESMMSGTLAGTGSFRCEECGYVVTLAAEDTLPECPGCGGSAFTRASLFGSGRFGRTVKPSRSTEEQEAWLGRAREQITKAGEHLVYEDGDVVVTVPLEKEWTRVGRSLA